MFSVTSLYALIPSFLIKWLIIIEYNVQCVGLSSDAIRINILTVLLPESSIYMCMHGSYRIPFLHVFLFISLVDVISTSVISYKREFINVLLHSIAWE